MLADSAKKKVFTCELCQKKFNKNSYLIQHKYSHRERPEFKCHCGRTYLRKDKFQLHTSKCDTVKMSLEFGGLSSKSSCTDSPSLNLKNVPSGSSNESLSSLVPFITLVQLHHFLKVLRVTKSRFIDILSNWVI